MKLGINFKERGWNFKILWKSPLRKVNYPQMNTNEEHKWTQIIWFFSGLRSKDE